MSGHSHWSTIKRQKQTQDAKKGQIFGRLARQITLAAQEGGSDSQFNSKLRLAIEQAKKENMPADKIERAIAKSSGVGDGEGLKEVVVEGYGAGGVALMVKASSDNKNRTLSEIKHIFQTHAGRVGEAGSAAFIFDKNGQPSFTIPIQDQDEKCLKEFLTKLREHREVVSVFTNA